MSGRQKEWTRREIEVINLVSRGLSNQEIAVILVVSINTVKSTLGNLTRRTGIGGREDLAAEALARGYVDPAIGAIGMIYERHRLKMAAKALVEQAPFIQPNLDLLRQAGAVPDASTWMFSATAVLTKMINFMEKAYASE